MRTLALVTLLLFSIPAAGCSTDPPPMPENPNLDIQIGQMLKIGFRGLSMEESSHIRRDLEEYHVGAVVLFDYDVPNDSPIRNVRSPQQLSGLVDELKSVSTGPLLVTIDQEGGRVARLKPDHGFPETRSARQLGSYSSADSTLYYASSIARTLNRAGINANLAPVVDVDLNPENPIIGGIERSFSSNPHEVAEQARLYRQAHLEEGVLTTYKHFPGHGSSKEDSHLGMVDVSDVWSEEELIPYRILIGDGDVDMIMTAHIFNEAWDEEYPATLSAAVINGILREDLGFDGVVLSDDMQMDAIRAYYGLEAAIEQAILAGVDILGFANNSVYDEDIVPQAHRIIRNLVDEGRISEERIYQSYQRIRTLKMDRMTP